MKKVFLTLLVATGSWICIQAQMSPLPAPKTPATETERKPTIVKADSLDTDLVKQIAVFSGHVDVRDSAFHMTADKMTVTFNNSQNGVDKIYAIGNVVINQVDKKATASQATYFVADKKIILTGSPKVIQGGNTLEGNMITFYRDTNRVTVDGRTTLVIDNTNALGTYSPKPAAPSDKQPPKNSP